MKFDVMRERIAALLRESRDRPLDAGEIASKLGLRGGGKKRLSRCLSRLVIEGEIVRIRGNRYSLGAAADLVTGTLTVLRSGNGFVAPGDGAGEVFVAAKDMGTALPRDRVVVRLNLAAEEEERARRSGKIVEILERTRADIVGTLKSTGTFLYVVPVDPAYAKDFYVADAAGAQMDDRVVLRFVSWEHKHVNPEGEIVEVLGSAHAPSVDTLTVMRQFGLPGEFAPSLLEEAESAGQRARRPGKRLDLRERFILTIDPKQARDFDDALSLEKDENGDRVLGVHIADVSHFVRAGRGLDKEAAERGNSVYLPDRVIPMLPESLSNGMCSLRPNEDRLAFSVFLTVDKRGAVRKRRFARSIIRSKRRLNYAQAFSALVSGMDPDAALDGPTIELLRTLDRLAQQLRRRRFARHALNLDVPECRLTLDSEGEMTGYEIEGNDRSHQLIEECMVAANEAVALELAERGIPLVSRFHEPPREEKIGDLTAELVQLGFEPGDLTRPRNLAEFLTSVKGHPLEYHVQVAVLRSMNRALYSAEGRGHFGLAKRHYAHFTSPIRRYPDLLVHRQLAAALASENAEKPRRTYTKRQLAAMARHCSETEQRAEEAERALVEIKKYRFLEKALAGGESRVFDAVVVKVTNFGMFVEVLDLQIQGLVHVSSISDRFVRYSRRHGHLRAGRQTYAIGRRMRVRVSRVDFEKRMVDFVPAK